MSESCWLVLTCVGLVLACVGLVLIRVDSCRFVLIRVGLCWYSCIRIDLILNNYWYFSTQNSFQRISVIFCLLVPDVLKIVNFFYNGFTLQQNSTLQSNNKLFGIIYIYRCDLWSFLYNLLLSCVKGTGYWPVFVVNKL